MAKKTLVTVGTDGFTNWVKLPSGEKLSLGKISVLSFVSRLSLNTRSLEATLKGFTGEGQAMLSVDEDAMWQLLAPSRAVWASEVSFMPSDPQTMPTIKEAALASLERHVEALNQFAGKIPEAKLSQGRNILIKLAEAVQAEEEEELEECEEKKTAHALASSILEQAEETVNRIEVLASEGKRFNAAKAKADLYEVTQKVASLLQSEDVSATVPAFQRLASQAESLHALFIPRKA